MNTEEQNMHNQPKQGKPLYQKPHKTMNVLAMVYFGFLWLGVTAVTGYHLFVGNEIRGIHVPRVLSLVYDWLGIEWGTVIQGVLSLIVILLGFKMFAENRKAKKAAMEACEEGLRENVIKEEP